MIEDGGWGQYGPPGEDQRSHGCRAEIPSSSSSSRLNAAAENAVAGGVSG